MNRALGVTTGRSLEAARSKGSRQADASEGLRLGERANRDFVFRVGSGLPSRGMPLITSRTELAHGCLFNLQLEFIKQMLGPKDDLKAETKDVQL
jgi:hypothetical protein